MTEADASIADVRQLDLGCHGDTNGWLTYLEQGGVLPFAIRRVFFIYGTLPHVVRGRHAHRKVWQCLVSVAGRCRVRTDDGQKQQEHWLNNPQTGLLLPPRVWREMDQFSSDCVLLGLASEKYDPKDYLRDPLQWRNELIEQPE